MSTIKEMSINLCEKALLGQLNQKLFEIGRNLIGGQIERNVTILSSFVTS